MSKNNKRQIAWLLLTLLGVTWLPCLGCWEYRARHSDKSHRDIMPEEETLLYRRCHEDTDCVYAMSGCCRCGADDTEASVNKALKPAFDKRVRQICAGGFTCPDIGRIPDCGTGGHICKNGICTYLTPNWEQKTNRIFWEYPQGVRHYNDPVGDFQ